MGLLWSVVVFASLAWNLHLVQASIRNQAYNQANAAIQKDMAYRHLVADLGGVYVRVDRGVSPNPFLGNLPERDVVTDDGQRLTLVNSSYFVRLVHEQEARASGDAPKGHVMSERPLRAEDSPDAWERRALRQFENGAREVSGVVERDGQAYFRLSRPRFTEASCLTCHRAQGFKIGEVLGGLRVEIPLAGLQAQAGRRYQPLIIGHLAIWLVGLLGLTSGSRRLSRQQRELYDAAHRDPLTGLPNRKLLHERLAQSMAQAAHHGHQGALLWLDLDRFKNINDSLGHAVGDALLEEVADRLIAGCADEDTVARLGGDEFVALLPELHDDAELAAVQAEKVAERFRLALAGVYHVAGYELHLTASIGIVLFPEQGEDVEAVLKHADTAMYRAKARGRNTIQFFLPALQVMADERLELEKDLHHALEEDSLLFHYQPQVDAQGRLVGVEALIRWPHPTRGFVHPEEFIPIAEDSGLILRLGEWGLRAAARQARDWLDAGAQPLPGFFAVNVSARQFHSDEFVRQVRSAIEDFGVEASLFKLELTESAVVDGVEATIDRMQQLRRLGFQFSIDDFGTGYSSLSYLKRLPLNELKIDRSFVADIGSDVNDMAIVETIIAMARTLGLEVVAEGVETARQVAFLRARGCAIFQGYYFSRPLPVGEMTEVLAMSRRTADGSAVG